MFSFMIPFFYIIDYISRYSKITEWIYFISSTIDDNEFPRVKDILLSY
jgi:hypothetical protein